MTDGVIVAVMQRFVRFVTLVDVVTVRSVALVTVQALAMSDAALVDAHGFLRTELDVVTRVLH